MAASMEGAGVSWTDLGPPLKMMPLGARRRISSTEMEAGTISE
jgi:hypothetical protein